MKRIKHHLGLLPAWILTIITGLIILWLTLAPHPLGDSEIHLFPGADKVVHALMFGFLTFMGLVDLTRGRDFSKIPPGTVLLISGLSTLLGVIIEFIQKSMNMGRSYDPRDIIADAIGSFIVGFCWIWMENIKKHKATHRGEDERW